LYCFRDIGVEAYCDVEIQVEGHSSCELTHDLYIINSTDSTFTLCTQQAMRPTCM